MGDNGLRVEIIVPRPRFTYEVKDGSVVSSSYYYPLSSPLPEWKTNVSVLTIYDTYGLTIRQQFLNTLVDKFSSHLDLLEVYLLECANILDVSTSGYDYTSGGIEKKSRFAVSKISAELAKRDALALKASESITSMSLPLEIVAQIVDSVRISKELALIVRARRSLVIPSMELVMGRADSTYSALFEDGYWIMLKTKLYHLSCSDNKFSLKVEPRTEPRMRVYQLRTRVAASISDYRSYYVSRICNIDSAMIALFNHLENESSRVDISQVCAWVVQLCYDTESDINRTEMTEDELRALLRELISKCRTLY